MLSLCYQPGRRGGRRPFAMLHNLANDFGLRTIYVLVVMCNSTQIHRRSVKNVHLSILGCQSRKL